MAANDSIARHGLVKDLTGQVFGRLTVVGYAGSRKGRARWLCECECGNTPTMLAGNLTRRPFVSCGCRNREQTSKRFTTHGKRHTPEYAIWNSMIGRCHREANDAYERYGGRGITVCERWRNSFVEFYEDMGPRPSSKHSIDRIENDGNYEKGNCRWATDKEQTRNARSNVMLTLDGRTQCVAAWAEEIGMNVFTLRSRLVSGWSVERALTELVGGQ